MPLSEIHVVCRGSGGITGIDDGTFLSGSWVIDRDEIIKGKTVFALHETTRELSYLQGVILEVREPTRANDRQQGRTDVVVRATSSPLAWRGDHPRRPDGSRSREKAYLWENDAPDARMPAVDADIDRLVEAWPQLPEAIRRCILAMVESTRTEKASTNESPADNGEFRKLSRVKLWAGRPHQTNHQIICAFLRLEREGEVTLDALRNYCSRQLKIAKFEGHYASMKTDAGNAHGKIFFDDGRVVKMWTTARREVDRYFRCP